MWHCWVGKGSHKRLVLPAKTWGFTDIHIYVKKAGGGKTFPLAEIGDGDNRFYLKVYSECSWLAPFIWIHQDAASVLSNKGRISAEFRFWGSFCQWWLFGWKSWLCGSCWKTVSSKSSFWSRYLVFALSLLRESLLWAVWKHLPALGAAGISQVPVSQWVGHTGLPFPHNGQNLASAPVLACHSQSGVTWCLK